MTATRLKIEFSGRSEDKMHVRLDDFYKELRAIYAALSELDRELIGKGQETSYYRVVGLSHSSPITCTIESAPVKDEGEDTGGEIFNEFVDGWDAIVNRKITPPRYSPGLVKRFRKIHRADVIPYLAFSIEGNGKRVEVRAEELEALRVEPTPRTVEVVGTVKGRAVIVNFMEGHGRIDLYPIAGPEVVVCHYPEHLTEDVEHAGNRWVSVRGKVKYKAGASYPTEIEVSSIEIHDRDGELPSLSDLFGIAPDATGDLTSEEFVRQIRDEEG